MNLQELYTALISSMQYKLVGMGDVKLTEVDINNKVKNVLAQNEEEFKTFKEKEKYFIKRITFGDVDNGVNIVVQAV